MNTLRIGLVSISDRASSGVYQDKGIPALEEWLASALTTPFEIQTRLIPDEQPIIEQTLCELVDEMSCHLVLTTGGTGPRASRRDAGRDAGYRRPRNAGLRRTDAPDQSTLCPDGNPFPPGGGDPQTGADTEPAWAAKVDQRDAGRIKSRGRSRHRARHICKCTVLYTVA